MVVYFATPVSTLPPEAFTIIDYISVIIVYNVRKNRDIERNKLPHKVLKLDLGAADNKFKCSFTLFYINSGKDIK